MRMQTHADRHERPIPHQSELGFTLNRDSEEEERLRNLFIDLHPDLTAVFTNFKKAFRIAVKNEGSHFLQRMREFGKSQYNCMKLFKGSSAYLYFSTVKLENLRFAYHVTNVKNVERILAEGLLTKRSSNNYWNDVSPDGHEFLFNNCVFLGYPAEAIFNTMHYDKSKYAALRINTDGLNLYFDASFARKTEEAGTDIASFVSFENIGPDRISVEAN